MPSAANWRIVSLMASFSAFLCRLADGPETFPRFAASQAFSLFWRSVRGDTFARLSCQPSSRGTDDFFGQNEILCGVDMIVGWNRFVFTANLNDSADSSDSPLVREAKISDLLALLVEKFQESLLRFGCMAPMAQIRQIGKTVISLLAAFDDVVRFFSQAGTARNMVLIQNTSAFAAATGTQMQFDFALLPVSAIKFFAAIGPNLAAFVFVAKLALPLFVTHRLGSRGPRLIHPQPDF